MLSKIPFNAQVGVIGHELAHVVDYENKRKIGIISTGVGYLFTDYKQNLENEIDKITIEHGLGWQIYDFADYILNWSGASEEYKHYKEKIYFSHIELLNIMKQYHLYPFYRITQNK